MIPPELPELIGGKYRPLGIIGEGAMGIVYSVEHILTGEQLALKVMTAHHGASRDAIERFKREARASAKIKSEHVVRIIDADVAPELDRAPYLVMDLLEGTDLEKASAEAPVAPAMVMEWLWQIARALEKAHRIGIVHRDLKPENLFLTFREHGRPLIKILDFGIAKVTAESTGTTQSGQILGTPLYMSPEQARGDPSLIGPSADLYALGMIAYKLLMGMPYWNAPSVTGIIGQVLYEPMVAPSSRGCSFGPLFDAWFLRACHRDAAERFTSAMEQVDALGQALDVAAMDSMADTRRSNPGASADGFTRPAGSHTGQDTAGSLGSETLNHNANTLVSSATQRDRMASLRTGRRRVWVYAMLSAAISLSIGVIGFSRRDPSPSVTVLATPAAAFPAPASAPALSTTASAPAPPPPAPSPAADTAVVEPPAIARKPAAVATAAAPKRREPAKPAPAARNASSTFAIHPERTSPSDPLGDQK